MSWVIFIFLAKKLQGYSKWCNFVTNKTTIQDKTIKNVTL